MQKRIDIFKKSFSYEPSYRWEQIQRAFFLPHLSSFTDVSTLSKKLRESLDQHIPWTSYTESTVFTSKKKDTYKAILTLQDGKRIETVLMENARDQWTICVSSQVGCAMKCAFCATGKMGFIRHLSSDEIVDQIRFWYQYLHQYPDIKRRISNIVFMGMGEPLANYDAVKEAIHLITKYTDIGVTHITVSTVGVLPRLEQILTDKNWPNVRLAISLHSAVPKTRKEIVPTSFPDFLFKLQTWAKQYLKTKNTRRQHLSFEYVMLNNINDSLKDAQALVSFAKPLNPVRINLIPYNFTHSPFQCSTKIEAFRRVLDTQGMTVTVRKTMGEDIAAACGQLITEKNKILAPTS